MNLPLLLRCLLVGTLLAPAVGAHEMVVLTPQAGGGFRVAGRLSAP